MSNAIPFNSENLKRLFSKDFLIVLLISFPSAIVADYFNIPLAWMIGPMIVVSIAALKGVKIIGTSVSATNVYSNANLKGNIGFVIGSEQKGLRRLVEKNCDELVSIPMSEKMGSLNASVTAGIVLFEYLKQNNLPNL